MFFFSLMFSAISTCQAGSVFYTCVHETGVTFTDPDGSITCDLCNHRSQNITNFLHCHAKTTKHQFQLKDHRKRILDYTNTNVSSNSTNASLNLVRMRLLMSRLGLPTNKFKAMAFELKHSFGIELGNNLHSRHSGQQIEQTVI